MSSKTKIFVFKSKELIYTAIFIFLAIFLIVLLVLMFSPKKEPATSPSLPTRHTYVPGVYSSSFALGDQTLNLLVAVDDAHINAIWFENLEESIETLYPLIPSTLQSLSAQIISDQSLSFVSFGSDYQYTAGLLLDVIQQTLEKALP